ncbi:MAG TPA: hypothetical protein VGM83_10685 [Devosiaceae bacterium]|jgi:hypothetical protein
MRTFLITALLLIGPTVVQAAENALPSNAPPTEETQNDPDAYMDDRSDPVAVITSFYNAINRQEYVRAYSYYGDAAQAGDYQKFADGYADTAHVELLTGKATSDGAAGSIYYSLPIAIDAKAADGSHKQYAGCYLLRLSNPQVQATPPFNPMHIEKGALKPASGALDAILPSKCDFD